MKDLIVYTDFSAPAKNAAKFASRIAQHTGLGIILCHACEDKNQENQVDQKKLMIKKLAKLRDKLLSQTPQNQKKPTIRLICIAGNLKDLAKRVCLLSRPGVYILGVHHAGLMGGFGLGHHYKELLAMGIPIILVPAIRIEGLPSRIAFVSDLIEPRLEADLICNLAPVISKLNASLLLVHVNTQGLRLEDIFHKSNMVLQELHAKKNFWDVHFFSLEKVNLQLDLENLLEAQRVDLLILNIGKENKIKSILIQVLNLDGCYHARVPLLIL